MEFTRVLVTGRFLHDKELHLGPRTRGDRDVEKEGGGIFSSGALVGYYLITPFQVLNDDSSKNPITILVNRGWVPKDKKDPATRQIAQIADVVTVEGLLRQGEKGGSFVPENRPDSNQWYWTDVKGMARTAGTEPVLVEMIADSKLEDLYLKAQMPLPRKAEVKLVNNHLQYAITWYGLCLVSSAMLLRKGRRGSFRPL